MKKKKVEKNSKVEYFAKTTKVEYFAKTTEVQVFWHLEVFTQFTN